MKNKVIPMEGHIKKKIRFLTEEGYLHDIKLTQEEFENLEKLRIFFNMIGGVSNGSEDKR